MTDSGGKRIRIPTEKSLQAAEEANNQKRKLSRAGHDGVISKKSKKATLKAPGGSNLLASQAATSSGVAQGEVRKTLSSASLRQSDEVPITTPGTPLTPANTTTTDDANESTITIDSSDIEHVPMPVPQEPRASRKKAVHDPNEDSEVELGGCATSCHPKGADELIIIERLKKDWNAPVYAFFYPTPLIEYVGEPPNRRRYHVFKCMGKGCTTMIRRYLDKGDAKSTSNMLKHVRTCKGWGEDVYNSISEAKDIKVAQASVKGYLANGSITVAFAKQGKVTYSSRQHTKAETRYVILPEAKHFAERLICIFSAEIVRWVAEDLHPFELIGDRGLPFNSLVRCQTRLHADLPTCCQGTAGAITDSWHKYCYQ